MNGTRLRGIRAERKASIKDCADAMRLSSLSYSKKERGEIDFRLSEIITLKKFLRMSIEEFSDVFFDGKLTDS